MDRFKSVLVEDGDALRTMAAYIDLNAVRAGLVKDPKDYRWCGYGEAMGGSKRARRGLCKVVERPVDSWEENPNPGKKSSENTNLQTNEVYRCWLFGDGYVPADVEEAKVPQSRRGRLGYTKKEVEKVKAEGGKLSRGQLLRCRVRYFSDGIALGSQEFVDEVFAAHSEHFGSKRTEGARALRELEKKTKLFSLRELRVKAVE